MSEYWSESRKKNRKTFGLLYFIIGISFLIGALIIWNTDSSLKIGLLGIGVIYLGLSFVALFITLLGPRSRG